MINTDTLIDNCRYCLESSDYHDMISPCKCKGSMKYVHRNCLINYLNIMRDRSVIPFNRDPYNYKCEICKTDYNVETQEYNNGGSLCLNMTTNFCIVTISLISAYFIFGSMIYPISKWWPVPVENVILEILFKGFVTTHIILAIVYFFISLSNIDDNICLCCFAFEININDSGDNHFAAILIILGVILVSFSVICVAGIYVDILSKVYNRHKLREKILVDVKNYPEPNMLTLSPEHFRVLESPVDL